MKRDVPLDTLSQLAAQPISADVLAEKYLKAGETTELQLFTRVARALASVEAEPARAEWEARFLDNLKAGAIGAGRIMSAAGTDLQATLVTTLGPEGPSFSQPVGHLTASPRPASCPGTRG